MIKFLFFFLFSLPVLADINVQLDVNVPTVKQGEITSAVLKVEGIALEALNGQTLVETIYVVKSTPSESKIIFIKLPNSQELKGQLNGEALIVKWNGVVVRPTEAPKELIFGSFEVPIQSQLMKIVALSLIILLAFVIVGYVFWKKAKIKKEKKNQKAKCKSELLGCNCYDDVVTIWKEKQSYFIEFPHVKEPFLKMELTLNLYQFKPYQSEEEKEIIMQSYHNFKREVEGGFNGI